MRFGTQTELTPEQVLERAREFFGPGGQVGLPEASTGTGSVTFAAEFGGVSVSVESVNGHTDVTILSREHDYWAERFIGEMH